MMSASFWDSPLSQRFLASRSGQSVVSFKPLGRENADIGPEFLSVCISKIGLHQTAGKLKPLSGEVRVAPRVFSASYWDKTGQCQRTRTRPRQRNAWSERAEGVGTNRYLSERVRAADGFVRTTRGTE